MTKKGYVIIMASILLHSNCERGRMRENQAIALTEISSRLDRNGDIPLYQQLGQYIREHVIANGEQAGNFRIPPEKSLSKSWGVSTHTVRQALNCLVEEGLLARQRGRGTFVRSSHLDRIRTAGTVFHHRIGLVMPWVESSFFASVFPETENFAHLSGFRTMLVNSWDHPETELDRIREMIDNGVDGVVWMCPTQGPLQATRHLLMDSVSATVAVDRIPLDMQEVLSLVEADNFGGMARMVRFLLQKGRCRIAYAGMAATISSSAERAAGYRYAMQEHGPGVEPAWMVHSTHADFRQIGLHCAEKMIASGQSFDAVCCENDTIAAGVIERFIEEGLQIPSDVAVTGFDDDPVSTEIAPNLTTMRMDVASMAREATQLLVEILQKKDRNQIISTIRTRVPATLIVRESTQ